MIPVLNYEVKRISTPTPDKVYDIVITVAGKTQKAGADVVTVFTQLIETTEKGRIVEYETNYVPAAALAAITGFDANLKLVVDRVGLNQILNGFNLMLVP